MRLDCRSQSAGPRFGNWTGRDPASRYVIAELTDSIQPRAQASRVQLMDDLHAHPPTAIIVDPHADEPGLTLSAFPELRALIAPTRKEEGCLCYELHRSAEGPAAYLLHEIWETREHHTAHTRTDHFLRWNARKDGC